jgi:hypothetical protein
MEMKMWVRLPPESHRGITEQVFGGAWKASESLIWLEIVTSFLCKMEIMHYKVSLHTPPRRRDVTRISFSSHKKCREFINNGIHNLLFDRYQVSTGHGNNNWAGMKLGRIVKIKGLSIYVDGVYTMSQREFNLEKLLGNGK